MEKTIKKELDKEILNSELLNDNSLIVVSKEENKEYPTVAIRYIENDSIKEDRIATLLPNIMIQHNDNIVAVFITKKDEEDTLITVYDLDYHTYVENDFLKTVYNEKVDKSKPMQYIKEAFK